MLRVIFVPVVASSLSMRVSLFVSRALKKKNEIPGWFFYLFDLKMSLPKRNWKQNCFCLFVSFVFFQYMKCVKEMTAVGQFSYKVQQNVTF